MSDALEREGAASERAPTDEPTRAVPPFRYIVVEGVIGVGKTTLVRALADAFDARTVLEVFDENPFLANFYADPKRYAFATEMFFLLLRYHQQGTFSQEDILQRVSVSDYLFEKCRIFAELTLEPAEFDVFERSYRIFERQVPTPDLVVHLHAPVDVLLHRIANRGRSFEHAIAPEYLANLDRAYRALFARYIKAPVLSIDTTELDFREPDVVAGLVERIRLGNTAPLKGASLFA